MVDHLGFFNPCHNGDIHVSRELVKYALEKLKPRRATYWHRCSPRLLLDVPSLEVRTPTAEVIADGARGFFQRADGTVVFSTWYRASPTWDAGTGCTLNTLHALFRANLSRLGHEMVDPVERFVPTIDFSRYYVEGVRRFFRAVEGQYARRVFVANSAPLSGQTSSSPHAMVAALRPMIAIRPRVLFLVTNRENAAGLEGLKNVAFTSDVIGLPAGTNDLCENAFVSTYCDVIVGLASGAYTFAYVRENLSDPRKTFVCFSSEQIARWAHAEGAVKARVVSSGATCEGEYQFTFADVLGMP